MPQEIKKRYVVRFKRKDIRPNKRDDKITILKNAVTMDPRRITRRDERVLGVHEVGENSTRLAEDPEKIVDINEFALPVAVVSLSPDQVEVLKKDKNVQWVYEDEPAGIRLLEQSEILPLAIESDVVHREVITENIKRMKAPGAWAYKTGYGVKVAIMDTGIDKTHPDLAANFKGGASFISGDNGAPGSRNDSDGGNHGTGCAGIVGARRGNGQGVVGMAPDCFLYDARVFSLSGARGISNSELLAAYVWTSTNNMDVVSMSFGANLGVRYDRPNDWHPGMKDQHDALLAGLAKGTIYIGACGNDGDNGKRSNKMADTLYPAAYDAVVSISAIEDEQVAAFSNSGNSVNFTAPGTNNQGSPNQNTTPYGLTCYAGRRGGGLQTIYKDAYGWFNGTSMACPHVAGVAALGYSAFKHQACVKAYDGHPTQRPRVNVIMRTIGFTADGLPGGPIPQGQDLTIGLGLPNAERVVRALLNINNEGNNIGTASIELADLPAYSSERFVS